MATKIKTLKYGDAYRQIRDGEIAPIYIMTGDERYLISQLIALLDKTLVKEASRAFDRSDFTEKTPFGEIEAALETPPFYSARKLVVVKNSRVFENKGLGGDRLFDKSFDLHVFVLVEDKVLKSGKAGQYLDACAALGGVIVLLDRQKEPQLIDFISRKAGQAGVKVTRPAAVMLIERAESDMSVIESELSKLFAYLAYVGSDRLEAKVVDLLVKKPLSASIFDLMDAVSEQRAGRALAFLDELIEAKEPPAKISFMIMRHLRRLIVALDAGTAEEAALALNVTPYRARHLLRQAGRYSPQQLESIHTQGYEYDSDIRKGLIPDRIALELLISYACEVV
jgi:DNA polymerase-3 subunit delta